MSDLHKQDDAWDASLADMPVMYCGRLDIEWFGLDGERRKHVYFEGEDESVVCIGNRSEFVAYAANRYQPLVAKLTSLHSLLRRIEWSATYRGHGESWNQCPACGGPEWNGHNSDCELAAAINPPPTNQEERPCL